MKKYVVLIFCVLLFSTFLIAQNRLPEIFVDNLGLDSNTISSTNTNGNINLQPNGTGSVIVSSDLDVGNLNFDINTISSTNTDGDIEVNANGTGETHLRDNVIVGLDGSSTQTLGGATVQNALDISNESSNDLGGLSIERHNNDGTFGAHILNLKSRGDFSTQTAVQDNDTLSRYVVTGHDGTDYEIAAEIRGVVDGTVAGDDVPGSIEFWTKEEGDTFSRRMYIEDDGRLVNNHDENIVGDLLVGTLGSPNASAVLQADSTTQGFLPPRMTAAQRDAISTPAEGLLVYANDTDKLSVYTGAVWTDVGSGGAGTLDTVFTEDHEDTFSMLTQNNSAFGGAGAFVGTTTTNTTTEINGDRDFLYTMATGCVNDYAASDEITLTEKADDNWVGISLYYQMSAADDSVKFVLFDDTNDVVLTPDDAYFKQTTNATRFETAVYIPDGVTSIRYGFQVETCTNTETFQWDDIEISTNPFVYKDIVKTNSINLEGNDGRNITANTESIPFDGTGTGWTSGANGSTLSNGNYYTVQNDNSVIQISGSVDTSSSVGMAITMNLNGSAYRTINNPASAGLHTFKYVSSKGELSSGDIISFSSTSNMTLTNNATNHYLNIVEQWQAEHIVTAAQSSETETKFLSANVTTDNADIADLRWTDLKVGDWYMVTLTSHLFHSTTSADADVDLIHDGNTIIYHRYDSTTSATNGYDTFSGTKIFQATGNDIRVSFDEIGSAAFQLVGNGDDTGTSVQLTNITTQFLAAIPTQETAYIKDVKSSGTAGGTFTSGAWQTRDLNTLEGDTSWVSLSSNQFTLAPGKYEIMALAPGFRVGRHKARLRNITDSTDVILGSSEHSDNAAVEGTSSSLLLGTIEITSSKTYEIQHRAQQTVASNGFGLSSNLGVDEIYATVKITKIK